MTQYDVIVVGVGGMGSAACYHLARRDVDVLGLERFDVPHARGSSHGDTRIYRTAYHEHPDYVPLARAAVEEWRALDAATDREVIRETGYVAAGPPDSETVRGVRESCAEHDIDHEAFDGAALSAEFPAFDVPDDYEAIYEAGGGLLRSEECVAAHVEGAFAAGGTVRGREPVESWSETVDGVRVRTDDATYTADHLVVAAGAWTGELVPSLAEDLAVERQVIRWFQPPDPSLFSPDRFPTFLVDTGGREFYGFPLAGRPGVKVGLHHHLEETVDPDDREAMAPRPEDERVLRDDVAAHVPAASGPTLSLASCLYTNSPDHDFVVDRLSSSVTVAAGFSGHGFKFSSAVGRALADLATEGASDLPIERFSLARL